MQTVTMEEAKTRLAKLIEAAFAGEEVFISKNQELSVRLVPQAAKVRKRQFGSAKGLISMASEFEEPLEDFKEYLR